MKYGDNLEKNKKNAEKETKTKENINKRTPPSADIDKMDGESYCHNCNKSYSQW